VHAEQNALLAAARFGIAVQGSTLYSTMRPCFGCTKEMLQAGVREVYYLHDWTHLDAEKRAEYERLQARFPGGIRKLEMNDPGAAWAVASRRDAQPRTADETGHTPG
jgi:dCMP deaminase